MVSALATVFAALAGLAFGSFLNVCVTRWPEGESIVAPRSRCRSCARTLHWWENFPVLSWLILRGRCRTCKASIPWRYPLVELAVATLWAVTWSSFTQKFLLAPELFLDYLLDAIESTIFLWLMIALAALDAENLWLPDLLTIPGMILGLAFLTAKEKFDHPFDGAAHPMQALLHGLIGAVIAAGLILLIRWTYKLIRHREGIGLGDAKLMAMLAAWLGLDGALLTFAIAVVLGAVAAIAVLTLPSTRSREEKRTLTKLPLGTFLCIGGIVASLWGRPILDAYLRWAGF